MEAIIWPQSGRYIVAVSGGVDSMTLLDLLAKASVDRNYNLIVAHFDHGIRPDSSLDAELVQEVANRYGLKTEIDQGRLGQASEAVARSARHAFLDRVRVKHQADAIITAHHQDDLIETSLLNLARGTGRRGLAPLMDGPIIRPLLNVARSQIIAYANHNNVVWRKDSTNANLTNPRNFLRHSLLSGADPQWRSEYIALIDDLRELNATIDQDLSQMIERIDPSTVTIDRQIVRDTSLVELQELIIHTAHTLDPTIELDQRLVQELALFAKTATPGKRRPVDQNMNFVIARTTIAVQRRGVSSLEESPQKRSA